MRHPSFPGGRRRFASNLKAISNALADLPISGTKRPRKKPEQRERSLQSRVMDYLDYALPPPSIAIAIPGGDKVRTTIPGYKSGTPDIGIIHHGTISLIELKDEKSGRVSKAQKELHPKLIAAGAPAAISRSLEDVVVACFRWQIPLRAKITAGGAWVKTGELA